LRGVRPATIIETLIPLLGLSAAMRRFFLALVVVAVSGCNLSTDVADEPTNPATETFASQLQVNIATMTKTTAGTYYRDLKVGDGTEVAGAPAVIISYQVFLKDGTLVSSVNSVTQLIGSLIPGLRDALQGMRPGGERLIVVPSALGYGNSTTVPGVPPNSTLVFDLLFKGYPLQ
jgi:FKBP-type peptidyl-prolyl cis-trans isomerase